MTVFCVTSQKKRWELKGEMPPRMDRFCAGGGRDKADTKNKRIQPPRMSRDLQNTRCVMPKDTNVSEGEMKRKNRRREEEKGEHVWVVGGFRCVT